MSLVQEQGWLIGITLRGALTVVKYSVAQWLQDNKKSPQVRGLWISAVSALFDSG
jgi:hypothetical protein